MIGDRWGVGENESLRAYPCDDFVASPALQAWRGISIGAPAGAIWQWVAQIRLAPYSYDWIDNRGRRSPRELTGLPEPRAGERFRRLSRAARLADYESRRPATLVSPADLGRHGRADHTQADFGTYLARHSSIHEASVHGCGVWGNQCRCDWFAGVRRVAVT
jgi:hypothetical protein